MPVAYKVYDDKNEQLKVYSRRLKLADSDFEQWESKCQAALSRYRNKPNLDQITASGHRVNVPTGVAIIDAMFSSLTAVEVQVDVKNVGAGTRNQAKIASLGIQDVWREAKIPEQTDLAVKDALLLGVGWIKVGYEYAEQDQEVLRSDEDTSADLEELLAQAEAAGEEAPGPNEIADLVPLTEVQSVATRDRIVVDHVPWNMIRFDHRAKRTQDVRWVAQLSLLPEHEVKENPVFRDYCSSKGTLKDLDNLNPDSRIIEERAQSMPLDAEDDRIATVEMWDFETGTVTTFTRWANVILNEQPNPLSVHDDLVDQNPFVPLVLRDDPEFVRGISDMDVVMPSLKELDTLRSSLSTYVSRYIAKLLGPEDALTEAGKEALRSPDPGEFVEISKHSGATSRDFDHLTPPQLPQEAFALEQRVENGSREATGVNELMRGMFPDRRRTATETAEVVSASTVRQAERRNLMSRWYSSIARRILWYMMMFYDQPRVSRVVNEADDFRGDIEWEWTGEDIASEINLEVVLSPKETGTVQERRDAAFTTGNLLLQLPPELVDHKAIVRWMLGETGLDPEVIALVVRTEEEQEVEEDMQTARQGEQAMAQQGVPPGGAPPEMAEIATEAGAAAQGVEVPPPA